MVFGAQGLYRGHGSRPYTAARARRMSARERRRPLARVAQSSGLARESCEARLQCPRGAKAQGLVFCRAQCTWVEPQSSVSALRMPRACSTMRQSHVAGQLRRQPARPMGSPRVGSNPTAAWRKANCAAEGPWPARSFGGMAGRERRVARGARAASPIHQNERLARPACEPIFKLFDFAWLGR